MIKSNFFDIMEQDYSSNIDSLKLDKDTVVIFQHIAKTGGMSLSEMLRKNIKPWYIIQWFRQKESWQECLLNLDMKGYRLVGGHIVGTEISKFPFDKKKGSVITMLRDPVKRMISHYYHGLRKHEEQFKKKYKNIESYIEAQPENLIISRWLSDQKVTNYEETISRIKERYDFIGVIEYSNHSVWILSKILGIPYSPLSVENKNDSREYDKEKVLADDRIVSMIRDKSQLDIKFFNYILDLYKNKADEIELCIQQE